MNNGVQNGVIGTQEAPVAMIIDENAFIDLNVSASGTKSVNFNFWI